MPRHALHTRHQTKHVEFDMKAFSYKCMITTENINFTKKLGQHVIMVGVTKLKKGLRALFSFSWSIEFSYLFPLEQSSIKICFSPSKEEHSGTYRSRD